MYRGIAKVEFPKRELQSLNVREITRDRSAEVIDALDCVRHG